MGGSVVTRKVAERARAWRVLCAVLAFGGADGAQIDQQVEKLLARTSVDPNNLTYGEAAAIYCAEFGTPRKDQNSTSSAHQTVET